MACSAYKVPYRAIEPLRGPICFKNKLIFQSLVCIFTMPMHPPTNGYPALASVWNLHAPTVVEAPASHILGVALHGVLDSCMLAILEQGIAIHLRGDSDRSNTCLRFCSQHNSWGAHS